MIKFDPQPLWLKSEFTSSESLWSDNPSDMIKIYTYLSLSHGIWNYRLRLCRLSPIYRVFINCLNCLWIKAYFVSFDIYSSTGNYYGIIWYTNSCCKKNAINFITLPVTWAIKSLLYLKRFFLSLKDYKCFFL